MLIPINKSKSKIILFTSQRPPFNELKVKALKIEIFLYCGLPIFENLFRFSCPFTRNKTFLER